MPLEPAEVALFKSLNFDPIVGELLRSATSAPISRLRKHDKESPGLSVPVADGEEAERLMKQIQPELLNLGCRAFWSHCFTKDGRRIGEEVAILRTTNPYEFITLCQTNGANYGHSTQQIITRLKSWESRCTFEVVGASYDWVALQFHAPPENICQFAEEIYAFCPDSVEQGVGLRREANYPEQFKAARLLCPKITVIGPTPEEGMEKLKARLSPEQRKQMEKLLSILPKDSPSSEMGIRLLAEEIYRTRYLFLWWD